MNFQVIARALDPNLYDEIQPYRVTDDALMPEEYRFSNPKGRPYHDDWAIFKGVRRMDCAYRIPLPFKIISGEKRQEWLHWDENYPLAPGHDVEYRDVVLPHGTHKRPFVLTDRGGYGLVTYVAWIKGEWVPCFKKYTRRIGSKRLSWYKGLHQDNHVSYPDETGFVRSDLMTWFPEMACSFVTEI